MTKASNRSLKSLKGVYTKTSNYIRVNLEKEYPSILFVIKKRVWRKFFRDLEKVYCKKLDDEWKMQK